MVIFRQFESLLDGELYIERNRETFKFSFKNCSWPNLSDRNLKAYLIGNLLTMEPPWLEVLGYLLLKGSEWQHNDHGTLNFYQFFNV